MVKTTVDTKDQRIRNYLTKLSDHINIRLVDYILYIYRREVLTVIFRVVIHYNIV